jgi:type 1 fimbria pilin
MRTAKLLGVALAMVFAATLCVRAADDKEVTLKGTITCAKCDLKEAQKCATVIQVKDGDKTVTYYFDADGDKANHKAICTEAKKGSVKGTVSEKDGKKVVKVSKVDFDK